MKILIMILVCAVWLNMPVLGFTEERLNPNSAGALYVQTDKNININLDGRLKDVFINKRHKENKTKRLIEKKAAVTAETKKNAQEPREKNERQSMQDESGLDASAYEQDDENAEFQRDRAVFNNKTNTAIRTQKRADKREEKETERKRKAKEGRDKGEGQFKFEF